MGPADLIERARRNGGQRTSIVFEHIEHITDSNEGFAHVHEDEMGITPRTPVDFFQPPRL